MTGDAADAERLFADALRLHAQGDLSSAASGYERLLRAAPQHARALTQLGVLRMQQKRLDEAKRLLDAAIALDTSAPEAHAWRGEVLRQQGQARAALEEFQAALARRPSLASAWFNQGLAHAELGEPDEARAAWLEFLEQRPADPRIRRELGRLAYERRRYDEAADWFTKQMTAFPGDSDAICDLATVRVATQAYGQAREALAALRSRVPMIVRAERIHAQALLGEGRAAEALASLRKTFEHVPDDAETTYQAGRACDAMARLDEAIEWFCKAAALAPERADVRNALAVAHLNLGDHAVAVENFRRAVALRPDFHEAHSNLLMALHYIDGISAQALFEEHLRWVAAHANIDANPRDAFALPPSAAARVRIGYVSPRFCAGPLMHFFLPLIAAHDRARFEVTCYAVSTLRDDSTSAMRAHADHWIECAALDDDALAALIRRDGIDILVDLVGHCPGNRLGVFARRAAPIQVTWMDYVDTTGLPTMDYVLTDEGHTPTAGTQLFSEEVARLADTRLCYLPIDDLPPLVEPPHMQRGYVTFGCFNRLSKFGDGVISAWSSILASVERSRLLLKSTAFAAEATRKTIASRFAAHGIDSARLDLRPFSEERSMLRDYGEVDVALDPFPYNGCTTTCDALAMGVPVVSLEGRTLPGRHGIALLGACGLHEWVAHSRDEYVALARRAAADGTGLADLRRTLRQRFLASPLCDAARFARSVESAYLTMVDQWRRPDGPRRPHAGNR